MAKSLPSDKLHEERLIKRLRDYQRAHPSNKRCFDCNEMMPQYICLDFNTFVCTACSGIHREFAHRVKSISMSKFTESEVKNVISHGGNEAAQKYWRNKHDPSFRPNGGSDGERTRNFIRLTYIDRKWVYESPRRAKDQESQRKSKSSKKKEKKSHSHSDDDFFSSSSKPSKSTTESGFGDFSNFEGSSRTAATVQSFGNFDNFESSAPAKKDTEGFADFGDFKGSCAAQTTTPKTTPPLPVPKFGSFKIAPPPGMNVAAPSVSAVPATEDLMGLSPPKQAGNPFDFDAPAPTTEKSSHPASVASSPFNFDAPTPTGRAGSRPDSTFLDTFSDVAVAVPSTSAPAPPNVSPFDAFGTPPNPKVSSPSAFDALPAPSSASTVTSNVFDAFGGGGDAFGDFTDSNTLSRTNSANPVLDPFASPAEKPSSAAASADPFAAFDGMQQKSSAASALGSAASSPDFGLSTRFPGGSSVSQQQAAMKDPLGFASVTGNNSGFSAAQQQQCHPASGATSQPFGGFSQQQPPQNAFGYQMQQQQPMQSFVHGQPPQNQQQWYGQQQRFTGQQQPMHLTGHQYTMQFPLRPAGGAPPAPITAKLPASASSIKDPFASLNIGNLGFGGLDNTTASRAGSGEVAYSAPFTPANGSGTSNSFGNAATSSGPISYAQPQARATASFPPPQPNAATFADSNAFGEFTGAPASAANPFDLF